MLRRRSTDPIDAIRADLDGYELPSFPGVAAQALQRLADPEVSMGEISAILEPDPRLTVHLLRLSNSAAFGLRTAVDSLDRAIALLGRNQVESILIANAVRTALPEPTSDVFVPARFWSTAAKRAAVASTLASVISPAQRSECFTTALLHDMALPVLIERVSGYEEVLAEWYAGRIDDLAEAELERFGWDHGAVGAELGRQWDLPESLIEEIASHHDPEGGGDLIAARLVAGWHEVDDEIGPGTVASRAGELAGLDDSTVTELVDEALERAEELSAVFA